MDTEKHIILQICINMDVGRVFHMKEGMGNTSYAQNSSMQRKGIDILRQITRESVLNLYMNMNPQSIGVADLGCSSGPNSLWVVGDIINTINHINKNLSHPSPEFRVFLNDLPTNDFNSIFVTLPDFLRDITKERRSEGESPSVFITAVPGSFYGRLFPSNSLHFIHSSYSLHWLSRVPPALCDKDGTSINKGKIYISETSPPLVSQAYLVQFKEDFTSFLKSRSDEVVSGGYIVFVVVGRSNKERERGNELLFELLAQSFSILVYEGHVLQQTLDNYDVHFYAPTLEEIKEVVTTEGSFVIERMEETELEKGAGDGKTIAMAVRAIQESTICHHFGEEILDRLFENYQILLEQELAKEKMKVVNLSVVLRKINSVSC